MSENKSDGQLVVDALVAWLSSYMSFTDSGQPLICALWVLHTWVSELFDATPYLCIKARTKGAGKSRLMELLAPISRDAVNAADMTPAAMFARIEERDCKVTLFFDEAEKMSAAAAGVMRSVMNTGYRQGQTVTRRVPGGAMATIDYRVYCPKAFALIGDVNDTLRDRAVIITLQRGKAPRDYFSMTAKAEAVKLVDMIKGLRSLWTGALGAVYTDFLDGRDREIFGALFGVAKALKLDKATASLLEMTAADMTGAKLAPAEKFTELARSESESDAADLIYGEKAMRDLASVFKEGEKALSTFEAIARMKAIPTGPWRTFKGKGLEPMSLAALVRAWGVRPKAIRVASRHKKTAEKELITGYSAADVLASWKREN